MYETKLRRAAGACLILALFCLGCGGGGDAPVVISFSLLTVNPSVSSDINGGDVVTITGQGFLAAEIVNVTFGGFPGTGLVVDDDTTLRVTSPPAPGGSPGPVTVAVVSIKAGTEILPGSYTYQGGSIQPVPQSISPTIFTATGAELFTIQGTNLGPPSGTVQVTFAGIGTVTANVSSTATLVTGNAPVSPGVPPSGALTVNVDTGTGNADVPTQVTYDFTAPTTLGLPGQAAGGASRPVRLADGFAVLCTAGVNNTWGDADDDLVIIQGPPTPFLTRATRTGGGSVGYLHPLTSIPAILDDNTVCVHSVGPDNAFSTGDDLVVRITNVQTTHDVTSFPFPNMNATPLTAVGPTTVAFTTAGTDGFLGSFDDVLFVFDFNGPAIRVANAGPLDVTVGAGNFSLPFTPDGEAVFVMSVGPNGTPRDTDDSFIRYKVSTQAATAPQSARSLFGRPLAISGSLLVAPAAGANGLFGDADDMLTVLFENGSVYGSSSFALGPISTTALVPYARIGSGVAVPVRGAAPPNDSIVAFTDPQAGTSASLTFTGVPLLAALGSGDLVVFGAGLDLTANTIDDQAVVINAAATGSLPFSAGPTWNQSPAALTDTDRAFGIGAGVDGVFGSGDEVMLVYQARAAGSGTSVSVLPMAVFGTPAAATEPFVPIGTSWGLVQSPGFDGIFGNGDDQLLVARY